MSKRSVPEWFDIPLDIVIAFSFVYHGYYVLSVFYIFHIMTVYNFHNKINEIRREKQLKSKRDEKIKTAH